MTNFIIPGTPEYAAACQAATDIIGVPVRYLAQYTHGARAIGMVIRRGDKVEVPIRRAEGKYGVTGGFLRHEHLFEALLREWKEEEMPQGVPLLPQEIFAYARFVGIDDIIGNTIREQRDLHEITLILLLELPDDVNITFTPSNETSEKVLLSYQDVLDQPHMFRGDGEYNMILRAAAYAAGIIDLPPITNNPLGNGVYIDVIDIKES